MVDLSLHEKLLVYFFDPAVRSRFSRLIEEQHFEQSTHKWLVREVLKSETPLTLDAVLHKLSSTPNEVLDSAQRYELAGFLQSNYKTELEDPQEAIATVEAFLQEWRLIRIANAAQRENLSPQMRLDAVQNLLREQEQDIASSTGEELVEADNEEQVFAVYDKDHPQGMQPILTPFPTMNSAFSAGGMLPGELGMIVGGTGVGKTFALCMLSLEMLKQNMKVLYIDLGDAFLDDLLSRHISAHTLQTLDDVQGDFKEQYREHQQPTGFVHLKNLMLLADSAKLEQIEADIRRYVAEHGLTAVILDYDMNISSKAAPGTDNALYLQGGRIYTRMKALAKELGILIVIGCQTNREAKKEDVMIWNVADSYAKTFPCDWILTIGRHEQYDQLGTAHIVKIRRGRKRSFKLSFQTKYSQLVEIPADVYVDRRTSLHEAKKEGGDVEAVEFDDFTHRDSDGTFEDAAEVRDED